MTTETATQDPKAVPTAKDDTAAVLPSRGPSQEDLLYLKQLKPYTSATKKKPYHPKSWLDRAEFFLGTYNELACADALKAHILCDEYVRELLPTVAKSPVLSARELAAYRDNACWVLYMSLKELGATDDAVEYYDKVPPVLLLPSRIPKCIDIETWKDKTKPLLARHKYPFVGGRQPEHIKKVQELLDNADWKKGMRIDRASFAGDADIDAYGIFTNREIKKERVLLRDPIVHADLMHVADDEQKPAMVMLEHVVKQVLADLDNAAQTTILSSVGANSLVAHYGVEPDEFSFHHLIKRIAIMLLKKDKLFDSRFDFYKWFTLYWQFSTNHFRQPFRSDTGEVRKEVVGIAPLYSFLNHSCEPNAKWSPVEKEGTDDMFMRVTTLKDIDANKEIFIPYITDEELAKPVSDRRAILKDWFGGDCMCTKCVAEVEALDEKSRRADAIAKAKAVPLGATSRLEGVSAKKKRKDDDDDSRPGSKRTRTEPHIQYSYAGS